MPNVTIAVPEELKSKMEALRAINWSEVAREAFAKTIELNKEFEEFKKIVSKSRLSDEDAKALGKKVNKSLHERYKKLYRSLQ